MLLSIVYGSKSKKWFKERKGNQDYEDEEKDGMGWAALYDGLQSDLYATIISKCVHYLGH